MATDNSTSDFFASKKKTRRKHNKLGFNVSAEINEQETHDIIHRIVHTLSDTALKQQIADCFGSAIWCSRSRTALTILRDVAFAFGTDKEALWPTNDAALDPIVVFVCTTLRDEIDIVPRPNTITRQWEEWGAFRRSDTKKRQYVWDLHRVEQVLSHVRFVAPEEAKVDGTSSVEYPHSSLSVMPKSFTIKIPSIVGAVAFSDQNQGISTSALVREARLCIPGVTNLGPLLRAIPELECRNGGTRYYLSNEAGYKEPFLVGLLSYGGSGSIAIRVLQKLSILFGERIWPKDMGILKFAMRFCGCKLSEQGGIFICWKSLGIFYTGGTRKNTMTSWDEARVKSILSSSLVSGHLDQDAAFSIDRILPLLDDTSCDDKKHAP